jgi:glycerol-1-phosphate dehydrogenase [NAD(P)+]
VPDQSLYAPRVSDDAIDRSLRELTEEAGGDFRKTRHVVVGPGVLAELATWLQQAHPHKRDVLVCDANTATAAGRSLHRSLHMAGRAADLIVLDPQPGEDDLVCDDEAIEALQTRLAALPESNAIAVGAGTINDIVKMATFRLGRPYQCVPTAASMNGYTSAIAAVLSRGVKRTLPAQQAEAVFADIDVVRRAPVHLNQAGFGDLLSKPYSNADWLLSHLVRGVPYEERPARLLDDAYDALLARAALVGAAEPEGIGTLTRTILLSGFTMAIAGTSAPASGGEHLVSHYWDMEQHCREQPLHGLHGTQVGIATRLSAMLFERLVSLDVKDIDPEAAVRRHPDPTWLETLRADHPCLTDAVVEEVRAQIAAKQRHGGALREELQQVRERWPEIRATLRSVLLPSARMAEVLTLARAPARPSDIGVEPAHAIRTLRVCRHIRGRYVAFDLMADLGRLHDWAAAVVGEVESAEG